jgi:acetyl esterase/lipase
MVPPEQVAPLRASIATFLLASQLTLVDMKQANASFAKAREMVKNLPEPSATYLRYVNDRDVKALGPVLLPHLGLQADPAASPERAASVPSAPIFLLHGDEDTVIPAAESVVLGNYLRSKGANVRVLLSPIITHAELDRSAAAAESWKVIAFWADILRR